MKVSILMFVVSAFLSSCGDCDNKDFESKFMSHLERAERYSVEIERSDEDSVLLAVNYLSNVTGIQSSISLDDVIIYAPEGFKIDKENWLKWYDENKCSQPKYLIDYPDPLQKSIIKYSPIIFVSKVRSNSFRNDTISFDETGKLISITSESQDRYYTYDHNGFETQLKLRNNDHQSSNYFFNIYKNDTIVVKHYRIGRSVDPSIKPSFTELAPKKYLIKDQVIKSKYWTDGKIADYRYDKLGRLDRFVPYPSYSVKKYEYEEESDVLKKISTYSLEGDTSQIWYFDDGLLTEIEYRFGDRTYINKYQIINAQ